MYSIYLVTNKVNGKVYVGQTKRTIDRRWRDHCGCAKHGDNTHFYSALREYGLHNFSVIELATVAEKTAADNLERLWISLLRATNRGCGYNATLGGDGGLGFIPTAETRAKMSAKKRGKKMPDRGPEWRAKISASKTGVKFSPEHCEARKRLCATYDAETRARISRAGMKHSLETRQRMSATKKGIPKIPEHRARISETRRRLNWSTRKVRPC